MEIKEILMEEGLRFTNQRKRVFQILKDQTTPITAEEIYLNYIKSDERISLSTIYRVLEVFLKTGIVNKSHLTDDSKASYTLNRHEHKHYLVCLSCKKMLEIDDCPFHVYEDEVQETTDFKITGHNLELYGYCPSCQ